MKKVYYEVMEFDGDVLKNMFYFYYSDILESKRSAELCYKSKISESSIGSTNPSINYQLVLTILENYNADRMVINQNNSPTHHLESELLSALTGRSIEVPEWPVREMSIFNESVIFNNRSEVFQSLS